MSKAPRRVPRTRHARSDSTRAALLAAAAERFARDGYERATIQQIATAAGVTAPTLYAHFETKEQLADALLDGAISEFRDVLAMLRFPRGLTFEQRLELLLVQQFRWTEERIPVFEFLHNFSAPGVDLNAVRRRRLAALDAWLHEHAAQEAWLPRSPNQEQPSSAAYLLDAIVTAAFNQWMDSGGASGGLVDAAPALVRTFVGGVTASHDEASSRHELPSS